MTEPEIKTESTPRKWLGRLPYRMVAVGKIKIDAGCHRPRNVHWRLIGISATRLLD
jgi:hypothetical protein